MAERVVAQKNPSNRRKTTGASIFFFLSYIELLIPSTHNTNVSFYTKGPSLVYKLPAQDMESLLLLLSLCLNFDNKLGRCWRQRDSRKVGLLRQAT